MGLTRQSIVSSNERQHKKYLSHIQEWMINQYSKQCCVWRSFNRCKKTFQKNKVYCITGTSSHRRCSIKKDVLKNFDVFFIKKETLAQVFSCEFCEIFKNTYLKEHMRTAASIQGERNISFSGNFAHVLNKWFYKPFADFRSILMWTNDVTNLQEVNRQEYHVDSKLSK